MQEKSHQRVKFPDKLGKFLVRRSQVFHLRKPETKNAGNKVLIVVRFQFKTIQ